jgi:predicted glycosyltransferase
MSARAPRVWIDLDNSPHVPLFAPLIRHLEAQGWHLVVTARDFAQTLDLVEQLGVKATAVGRHAGRNKIRKVANLPVRATQLVRTVLPFRPELALSHGSRTQTIAARMLRTPSVVMFDYEWTEMEIFKRLADHLVCPRAISPERLEAAGIPAELVSFYDGFKEELYLPEFVPDPGFRASIGVGDDELLVTIRPPGLIGNYHDARSEAICRALIARVAAMPGVAAVILPKTAVERELVDAALPESPVARIIVPERAIPGLQLLYSSDLAVSGGGTMNRESALLGVPTYSMFTGRRAAIDEELARQGRLAFLESEEDLDRIRFVRRAGVVWEPPSRRLIYELEGLIRMFGGTHS